MHSNDPFPSSDNHPDRVTVSPQMKSVREWLPLIPDIDDLTTGVIERIGSVANDDGIMIAIFLANLDDGSQVLIEVPWAALATAARIITETNM